MTYRNKATNSRKHHFFLCCLIWQAIATLHGDLSGHSQGHRACSACRTQPNIHTALSNLLSSCQGSSAGELPQRSFRTISTTHTQTNPTTHTYCSRAWLNIHCDWHVRPGSVSRKASECFRDTNLIQLLSLYFPF